MKKNQRMSGAEKEIMAIVWKSGQPVTTKEILAELSGKRAWKQNTVITFLSRLMDKGMLQATRISKANYYEARITEPEYLSFATRQFVEDIHRGSTLGLVNTLCDAGDLTREDLLELLSRLSAKK